MSKTITKIKETTEKFDKDGNLIERVVREETTEDDTNYTYTPYNPYGTRSVPLKNPFNEPYCSTDAVYHSDTGNCNE